MAGAFVPAKTYQQGCSNRRARRGAQVSE